MYLCALAAQSGLETGLPERSRSESTANALENINIAGRPGAEMMVTNNPAKPEYLSDQPFVTRNSATVLVHPVPATNCADARISRKMRRDARQPIGPRRRVIVGDRQNIARASSQPRRHGAHNSRSRYFNNRQFQAPLPGLRNGQGVDIAAPRDH
jgi:hypothetical protein